MKRRMGLFATFFCLFVLAGCQSVSPYGQSGVVDERNRISVQDGTAAGTWQSRDLEVEYKYSRGAGRISISGTVYFAQSVKFNFTILQDFRLAVFFLNEQGKVLETRGLATDRNSFDPVPFHSSLPVPADTQSIAFSYQGTGIEGGGDGGGGGGLTRFWHYPVR